MGRARLTAILFVAIAASTVHADTNECLAIEQAFAQNRLDTLDALSLTDPYWQALRQFRLAAIHIPGDNRPAARDAVLAGLDIVNQALKAEPDNVEMLLMGAMLDGQILLLSPWRFFHNGRRGLKRLSTAERLAPENPRATLVRGTALVVLPAIFGGSAKEAITRFDAALEREDAGGQTFANSALCERGQWAQVDLLNWLGRALDKAGRSEEAALTYRRALARSPDNHWVRLAIEGRGYEWSGGGEPGE